MIPATHLLLVMLGLAMLFGALLPNSNWRAALIALCGVAAVVAAFNIGGGYA